MISTEKRPVVSLRKRPSCAPMSARFVAMMGQRDRTRSAERKAATLTRRQERSRKAAMLVLVQAF